MSQLRESTVSAARPLPVIVRTSSSPNPGPVEAAAADQAAGEPSRPAGEVCLPLYLQELEARIGKTGEVLAKVRTLLHILVIQAAHRKAPEYGR